LTLSSCFARSSLVNGSFSIKTEEITAINAKVDSSKLLDRLYHRLCFGIRAVGVRNGIQLIYKSSCFARSSLVNGSFSIKTEEITAINAIPAAKKNGSKAMGYVSAAISTGFIIGPGIGGFIADHGVRML
jgi:hypothetical protein